MTGVLHALFSHVVTLREWSGLPQGDELSLLDATYIAYDAPLPTASCFATTFNAVRGTLSSETLTKRETRSSSKLTERTCASRLVPKGGRRAMCSRTARRWCVYRLGILSYLQYPGQWPAPSSDRL